MFPTHHRSIAATILVHEYTRTLEVNKGAEMLQSPAFITFTPPVPPIIIPMMYGEEESLRQKRVYPLSPNHTSRRGQIRGNNAKFKKLR